MRDARPSLSDWLRRHRAQAPTPGRPDTTGRPLAVARDSVAGEPRATSGAAIAAADVEIALRHHGDRLAPDPQAMDRVRAAVLATFEAAQVARLAGPEDPADLEPAAATGGASPTPRSRGRLSGFLGQPLRLRIAGGLAAAAVLAGGTGAALAASAPGGPLYTTRLDVEALTLPPSGTAAWFEAEISRLGARLGEAQSAARADNAPAVEAAVHAYESILSQTVTATETGLAAPDAAPTSVPPGLAHALDRHEALLSSLIDRAPAAAQPALRAALGQVGKAAAAAAGPGHPQPGPASGPLATPSPRPGNAGNPPGLDRTHAPVVHPPKKGGGSAPGTTASPEALSSRSWTAATRLASTTPVVTTPTETRGSSRGHAGGRGTMLAGFTTASMRSQAR
jgi:hypothetical protein